VILVRSVLAVLISVIVVSLGVFRYRDSTPPSATATPPSVSAPTAAVSPEERAIGRAQQALVALKGAADHGLNPAKYPTRRLETALERAETSARTAADRAEVIANLEAQTKSAIVPFAHDVAAGRRSPTSVELTWKNRRPAIDIAESWDQMASSSVQQWIDGLEPPHPEYRALLDALRKLRQQQNGGWPKVPRRVPEPGSSDPAVQQLRERLTASGDLADVDTGNPANYDAALTNAVKRFQERHALPATGIANEETLAEMNVPLADRIRQVEMNLDRWRWMPNDLGPRHLLINIPAFQLTARENGKPVRAMRVVVGKTEHETPIFGGEMDTVVFSPYWNLPESIALDEIGPAIRSDPGYLARNQIEVLRRTKTRMTIVNPDDVNWYDPAEFLQLSFRQRPGTRNALGQVKFLFPNAFDVYLHDTPADSLFGRSGRAFSHGCVRVEEPEALAAYVLRGLPDWTADRISSAMNAGVEKYVKLGEKIPVHVAYFTAWVADDGRLTFLPDVYGYDARQARLTR
jgi:murein L,D-transpeptidase YcbB/YkuD